MKTSNVELENELFKSVYDKTPDYIKNLNLMDFSQKGEFTFTLKREHLKPYDKDTNPEGLNLEEWFTNYAKEAKVSTAGIRGPQNILYPQDTRFPINLVGIVLATLAKALVANEKYKGKKIVKVAGREVRYNSDLFLDAITRVQAAQGIRTLVPEGKKTIPIWLASFLAFKLDLLGGEYITSSHGISVKNATKDLNCQGSQYLPEESMEFVNKIQEIFNKTEKDGTYEIKIAATNNPLIDELTEQTISDNARFFEGDKSQVPTKAVTMGLASIMRAKKIILIATGANKADAVYGMLKGEKTIDCPASILQDHADVTVIMDEAAASKL